MGGSLWVVPYGWFLMGGFLWVVSYGWFLTGRFLWVVSYGWRLCIPQLDSRGVLGSLFEAMDDAVVPTQEMTSLFERSFRKSESFRLADIPARFRPRETPSHAFGAILTLDMVVIQGHGALCGSQFTLHCVVVNLRCTWLTYDPPLGNHLITNHLLTIHLITIHLLTIHLLAYHYGPGCSLSRIRAHCNSLWGRDPRRGVPQVPQRRTPHGGGTGSPDREVGGGRQREHSKTPR